MKSKLLILGIAFSLMTVSCSRKEKDNSTITADEASVNAKIDLANDDISSIVENEEAATYGNSANGKTMEVASTTYPIVTRVPAFGTPPTVGQMVTKTIDYGTTGVTLANGNVLKGIINISFVYDPTATSHTINYSFQNFYHNGIEFNGNKTFTRTMTTGTDSHPIVTMNMDMNATFPDGRVFNRVGTRTREITAGYNTPNIIADNIYQVTGNWTTTFPAGTRTSTITTPLRAEANCPHIVSGVITTVRDNNTATLDYGNGDCDNQATLTVNGNSTTITLGN